MTERPDLRTSLDTPAGKRRYVRRLFATIADRYDLITGVLSYGATRAGSGAWSRCRTRLPARARSISRAARVTSPSRSPRAARE